MISAIIGGLIVGLLARLFMPGPDPYGIIVTILLGIGGAFIANLIGQGIGWYGEGDGAGWIASILGAMLLIWVVRSVGRTGKAT